MCVRRTSGEMSLKLRQAERERGASVVGGMAEMESLMGNSRIKEYATFLAFFKQAVCDQQREPQNKLLLFHAFEW